MENSGYSMLRDHKCFTYADTLRYGIKSKCLDTTKVYDMNNKNMVKKIQENARSHKKVEEAHQCRQTVNNKWKLPVMSEGKAHGAPRPHTPRGSKRIIIPHESVPGNYIILEIQPQKGSNSNGTVPKTTRSRERKMKTPKGDGKVKDTSLSQVSEIMNAQTNALWEVYGKGKKETEEDQDAKRRGQIYSSMVRQPQL